MKNRWTALMIAGLSTAILAGCGSNPAAEEAAQKAGEAAQIAGQAASKASEAAAKAGEAVGQVASEKFETFEATIKDAMTRIPNLDMTKIELKREGNTLKVTGDAGNALVRQQIDEQLMKLTNPLFKIDTTGLKPTPNAASKP